MNMMVAPYRFAAGGGGIGGVPAFVAVGALGTTSGSSRLPAYPAGIAAGDLLELYVSGSSSGGILDISGAPSGSWTEAIAIPQSHGGRSWLFYKRAIGSESGTETITFSPGAGSDEVVTEITAYRGVKSSGTPYEALTWNAQASTTSVIGRDIATTGINRRVLTNFGHRQIATTGSNSNGWDEDWDVNSTQGNDATAGECGIDTASAGAVPACTRTLALAATSIAIVRALLPDGESDPAAPAAIAVRGTRITHVNNANSLVFTLPPSSAAGDYCLIFAGHGFSVSTPAGWGSHSTLSGTNFNGAFFWKVLTSGDISTGTVTIGFGGVFYGVVAGISFDGEPSRVKTFIDSRNSTGASTRNITSDATPAVGDYAVYFGSGRANSTITCDLGSALETVSATNASGVLTGETLASGGAVSPTFSFSVTPTGDFVAAVVLTP